MLDKNGNWLEAGDYVWHSGRECVVRKIDEEYIYLNAIDGSLYSSLRDGREVILTRKSTNVFLTYYKYQGSPAVSCVTLEALLKLIAPFEDNYQESVYVEEVQLIVDKKDLIIIEHSKIIGYVKEGRFVTVK